MGLEILIEKSSTGNSLAVQWLRSHASSAGVSGSIPGQGTKIPHACHLAKKKKKSSTHGCYLKPWGWMRSFWKRIPLQKRSGPKTMEFSTVKHGKEQESAEEAAVITNNRNMIYKGLLGQTALTEEVRWRPRIAVGFGKTVVSGDLDEGQREMGIEI